jgi:hypothetical protein
MCEWPLDYGWNRQEILQRLSCMKLNGYGSIGVYFPKLHINDMSNEPSPQWRCIDISFMSLLLLHKTPQYNCGANQSWETMSPDRLNEQLLRGENYATWMRETFSQRYHQSGGRKQYSVSLWRKGRKKAILKKTILWLTLAKSNLM